ncbi:putative peptidase C78, ubiquitin modifier-specific peptidase 1/ 2 [Helianthus annuus]|nr:putative peptidase C78, ubiquitin modifier-specific peptidase 1/ 2 [Helianthus annuus]
MWSSCPFCTLQVLSTELQRHANNHFEDEDQDVRLANHNISVDNPMQAAASVSSEENIRRLQVRDANLKREVKHGFMTLLNNCLESESGNSINILSGYTDHFQSLKFEDVGWGCGWRNIQMLASHLLVQRQEAREVLFGGVGFVPDIPSLQRWLEIAWGKGFDAAGSNDFDQKIYGKRTWIGTTECAALFRSFGLRARIADFCFSTPPDDVVKPPQVIGPMDKYLNRSDASDPGSSSNAKCCPESVNGQQLLANWVWSYFSDNSRLSRSGCNQVVVTEKAPLYFQHDGHSRTIVGIQLKNLPNGMQQSNLLILDPAHKTQVLESCLSKKVGWQRFIKRGVHTLKKTEYQLCYVDPGIAAGPELEKLKTLDSSRFEFEHLAMLLWCVISVSDPHMIYYFFQLVIDVPGWRLPNM